MPAEGRRRMRAGNWTEGPGRKSGDGRAQTEEREAGLTGVTGKFIERSRIGVRLCRVTHRHARCWDVLRGRRDVKQGSYGARAARTFKNPLAPRVLSASLAHDAAGYQAVRACAPPSRFISAAPTPASAPAG